MESERSLALGVLALLIYPEASYMHVQTRVHGFPRKPGNPSEGLEEKRCLSRDAQHRAKGDQLRACNFSLRGISSSLRATQSCNRLTVHDEVVCTVTSTAGARPS